MFFAHVKRHFDKVTQESVIDSLVGLVIQFFRIVTVALITVIERRLLRERYFSINCGPSTDVFGERFT